MAIDLSSLPLPTVYAVIDALQQREAPAWRAWFAPFAKFYDDGNPRDLVVFTRDALGHERIARMDYATADGLGVQGLFHSHRWGDFLSCFRLTLCVSVRAQCLDIGQTS